MKEDNNRFIENFLEHLDQALTAMPVSQKAEIVIEMRSHILDTLESSPEKEVQKVLAEIGNPNEIANRYLFERGITPNRKAQIGNNPNGSWAKWLAIGAIGSSFLLVVLPMLILLIAAPFFSPFVEVDKAAGKVRLLNGLIKVDKGPGHYDRHTPPTSVVGPDSLSTPDQADKAEMNDDGTINKESKPTGENTHE